ncbi:DUF2807 domain-containing protein [Cytophagales bacterium LB-30]|uniref:DUF2807 domain-containing protein n=1 Tax=Shiella aurantiaca TaxID=3058365 RepID=A0ABT8F3P8_9BACT|nr:DUF2807 domain-containing protein [Shiella aurantiaca]MDN4164928.1 DUF2807 domain-containing protein [Shiella aurantiaca]
MKTQFILLAILTLFTSACSDAWEGCTRAKGKWQSEYFPLQSFEKVSMYDRIDLHLVQSDSTGLKIEYFENDLESIQWDSLVGELSIKHFKTCEWAKTYEAPKVTLYFNNLSTISQFGSGIITNEGNLQLTKLHLEVKNASGNLTLRGDFGTLTITSNGISNITLQGTASEFRPGYYFNDGRLYASDLVAEKVFVRHRGYNDLYIHASSELTGFIENTGNVYYQGNPSLLSVEETWEGKLIRQ